MTAVTGTPVEEVVAKQSASAQARQKLSSPWASLFAVVIGVIDHRLPWPPVDDREH